MKEITPLEEAEKNLNDFLEEYPQMQPYQDKINDIMSKTLPDQRLEVLNIMTAGLVEDAQKNYEELKEEVVKIKQNLSVIKD